VGAGGNDQVIISRILSQSNKGQGVEVKSRATFDKGGQSVKLGLSPLRVDAQLLSTQHQCQNSY
jgi:hypothetical protein